jgi:hypothetical protein
VTGACYRYALDNYYNLYGEFHAFLNVLNQAPTSVWRLKMQFIRTLAEVDNVSATACCAGASIATNANLLALADHLLK